MLNDFGALAIAVCNPFDPPRGHGPTGCFLMMSQKAHFERKVEMPASVRLLEYKELKSTHGIRYSRTHLQRLENQKKFPRRVSVGEHHIGWVESEIVAYVKQQIAARG